MWSKSVSDQKQIAIIGAGFGGCSTAYFLRCLVGNTLGIRIFERSDRIGGRVRAIRYKERGELYESGGAIFTSSNKYMHMLANEFRLELRQHPPPDGALCLYNGYLAPPSFFTKDGPLRLNRIRFVWKYCIGLLRFKIGVNQHVKKFSQIYERQKNREAFQCPLKMLSALSKSFVPMLKTSFGEWLKVHLKLSEQFCNEVVYGFVAQCYCSDLTVHAFAGMTASSGLGAALYSIVGGNEQIAQNLAAKALSSNPQGFPCHVSLNTTVTKISKGSKRRYRLTYEETDSRTQKSEEFDYVVLAFPIHEKSVMEADPEIAQVLPEARPYMTVDFTHFHGDLSSDIFSLPKDELKDEGHSGVTILPTQHGYNKEKGTLFKYLGRAWSTAPVQEGEKASGCFSALSVPGRTPNPGDEIPHRYAVGRCTLIDSTRWYAFPIFNWVKDNLDRRFTKFVLADGLIYVNAIEQLASNMEFALIGGYNAALLIARDQIPKSN